MSRVTIANLTEDARRTRTLGVIVGSFDPLHRGHEWMVRHLLRRCDRVLLLVPFRHFDKHPVWPANATFSQRLTMIDRFSERCGGRVLGGVTHEALFVRLADELAALFSDAAIIFAMGDDTWQRLLRSSEYYARLGLPWTAADAGRLARLRRQVMVFGRSGDAAGRIRVPAAVRDISATRIRALAVAGAGDAALCRFIAPDILAICRHAGLYRGPATDRPCGVRASAPPSPQPPVVPDPTLC
ncbi:MAG TPA: adenylyltransferase/cytidyltransferase family protein [Acidobacteriota bacterium]|nr:adenylyltransferase/cytidyltransferase family protein [Acidobacteriota bacterium]HOS99751.1 adenylyltransferase/cytidyltransferase family protein [Acidobacteriota bacterium]HQF86097.1 adenylyltransferase/cytidyltransferase family protein [Acidobacteriota bacterium]HQG90660.1 adenylyltransferase/cytidyltransferase family protein [Acidobacteriota bacterium]HQK89392.1 adenylyltransferase/cytidyltransferase family protein [Acidobacteriota bacterium]